MTEPMVLDVRLNSPAILATNQPRLLYLLATLKPTPTAQPQRAPVNLVVIVDASNSMLIPAIDDALVAELSRRGLLSETIADGLPVYRISHMPDDLARLAKPVRSIESVQFALRILADRLNTEDRMALIAFATQAETVTPNLLSHKKDEFSHIFDRLSGGGFGDETLIAPGLRLALQEALKEASPERVTRILLLTDGFAGDEAACHAAVQDIAAQGYPLSTFGLGLVFNEGLLISLAESSGGSAHLIFEADDIPAAFQSELEMAQSVLLRSLELKTAFTPGVELRRAHLVRPVISEIDRDNLRSGTFNTNLGDLIRDKAVSVLLELVIPPKPVGTYRIAQIAVAGTLPGRKPERVLMRQDVVISVQENNSPVPPQDSEIMNLAERVGAFRLQTRALDEASAGDIGNATRKLQAAATRLLALGEHDLAQIALAEADNLSRNGQASQVGTKTLRYETRKLTQKLD